MEHCVFRDYCKAENSEDEEVNSDLQSRLYAEVYYASNSTEDVDTKTDIKLETPNIDNEELCKGANTNKTPNPNDNFTKHSVSENHKNICITNNSKDNDEEDDKSNIKTISVPNEVDLLQTDDKSNLNVPCMKVLQHSQGSIECSKSNKESVACHKTDNIKSNIEPHNAYNISEDVLVKPETELESREEFKFTQYSHSERSTTVDQFSHRNSRKSNIDNSVERISEVYNKQEVNNDNSNNILKKYEFSKLFINRLYLEKYENLEKRLQELEEEKEREETNIEEDEENQQQLDTHVDSTDQMEKDTRYEIFTRNEKIQKTSNYAEEVMLLSSEMESDSEVSILEVPIPPKPQPPVINLQDSDEGSEILSSDSDMEQDCLYEKVTYMTDKHLHTNLTIPVPVNNPLTTGITDDIVLNCTEIQEGVSSIKEIMKMSKNIQNKSIIANEIHNKNLDNIDKSLMSINEKDDIHEFQLPLETFNNSNVVYERDKNKSVNFAEDVVVTNFQNSNELSSSRKRRRESDSEPCTNAKQKKNRAIENKCSETSSDQHQSKDKNKQESWEEYFFRPMSDNLKTFYNESRGQENINIQEIQSKMSKDPRLWAILDEDLMPHLSRRQRFWNAKCNNCQREGHQTYNCPEPRKPPRCHMCGTQGHTETRCPQKMCLTCGKKQGTFRKTCESCRTLYCNMCKAIGHNSTECPDLWRRFHQTTRNSEINIPENLSEVMKPADLLYCCNCTKRGHDSSTCYEYRWSQHFPTPAFVSNYGNGPECEEPVHVQTNEDIIPLSKSKKNKGSRTRELIFLQGKDNLQGCSMLYSYGTFYTKRPNGEEVIKRMSNDLVPYVNNFLKGCIAPSFLEQLQKTVKFEIKIFRNPQKVLMIRIRSIIGVPLHIYEIFIYWLQLRDDEKLLNMHINLPRGTKKMLKLLTTKWEELEQDLQDPKYLCNQIEQLKKSMTGIQQSSVLSTISEKILDLRSKLMKVYHLKPSLSHPAVKLRKIIKKLNKKSCNLTCPMTEVNMLMYLQIITLYNKIFVPRTLTDTEIQGLFRRYYKEKKNVKDTGKENEGTRKQKKLNPYEAFIQNLKNYNISKNNTQHKQTSSTINNNTTRPSEVTRKQDKQTPTITSTVTIKSSSASSSIQSNNTVTNSNIENVPTETCNWKGNVAECSHDSPTEVVQLPHNQDIVNSKPVENTVKKVQKKINLSNLIYLPLKKSICSNTSSRNLKNDELSSVPCTEIRPEGNIEKGTEIIKNNSEAIQTSNLQQEENTVNPETSVTKKKKFKKGKKAKPDLETNSQLGENQVMNTDKSIENKAKKVITEALEFNLPYMNKAVEEIEKRINDKNIKPEHIDVLQRLINLEKDHQQYVSSFCSYLK